MAIPYSVEKLFNSEAAEICAAIDHGLYPVYGRRVIGVIMHWGEGLPFDGCPKS
jgi:hypothetical protein